MKCVLYEGNQGEGEVTKTERKKVRERKRRTEEVG